MISHVFKRYEVLGIAGFCLLLATAANAAPPAKIDVCHVPPDTPENIQRILVGANGGALDDHLTHGDWLVSEEMCDAIADNNCDGEADAAADDADCTSQFGAGATCAAGVCVDPDPLLTCPCWAGSTVSALALVIDDTARSSDAGAQREGLLCDARYFATTGSVEDGAAISEASNGNGDIPGIGFNLSYNFGASLRCADSIDSAVACQSPAAVKTIAICQKAEYDATSLANNRGRMVAIGGEAGTACVRELDAAFRARTFVPNCDALTPPPSTLP